MAPELASTQRLLTQTLFPDDGNTPSATMTAIKDPLSSQVWRMYTQAKDVLPNGSRIENLTWRLMAMTLKSKKERAAEKDASDKAVTPDPSMQRMPNEKRVSCSMSETISASSAMQVHLMYPHSADLPKQRWPSYNSITIPTHDNDAVVQDLQVELSSSMCSDIASIIVDPRPWENYTGSFFKQETDSGPATVGHGQYLPVLFDDNQQLPVTPASEYPHTLSCSMTHPADDQVNRSDNSRAWQSMETPVHWLCKHALPLTHCLDPVCRQQAYLHPGTEDRQSASTSESLIPSASTSAPMTGRAQCTNCSTYTTTTWRKCPKGKRICNACGLFLNLHGVPRPARFNTNVIKRRNRGSNILKKLAARRVGLAADPDNAQTSLQNDNSGESLIHRKRKQCDLSTPAINMPVNNHCSQSSDESGNGVDSLGTGLSGGWVSGSDSLSNSMANGTVVSVSFDTGEPFAFVPYVPKGWVPTPPMSHAHVTSCHTIKEDQTVEPRFQ